MAVRTNVLVVKLGGERIGTITRLAGERHVFAFDDAYVADTNRPTLSLGYKGRSGGIVTAIRALSVRVPPFFSNLLPEGHLREYLAARAGVKPVREFFLLEALGADLPGAVTVHAEGRVEDSGDTDDEERSGRGKQPMRFSLAGVQLKFSAIMESSGGLTIPAKGEGGRWIVKLPSARFVQVPENEFVMMELARRVGIEVPRLKLVSVREIEGLPDEALMVEGNALAVERFDRTANGGRIHMEDFAQVFGVFPDDKYEKRSYANVAAVLAAEIGDGAVVEFVRRIAFSVMIGNADMHLKNWSLLYPDGRKPRLAPAYDYVSTVPYLSSQELALGFGGSKALTDITPDQVRRFADAAKLSVPPLWKAVIETAGAVREAWQRHSERDLLPADVRWKIESHLDGAARNIARYERTRSAP